MIFKFDRKEFYQLQIKFIEWNNKVSWLRQAFTGHVHLWYHVKLKIITGTCFPSHKDYMHTIIYYDKNFICLEPSHQATLWWKLQWITATELVDLWSLKEKKQYKWTDKGYRRSCTQNHRGWGYMLFTGCLSSVFSKRNNIFSCVNVRKKLSHWQWPTHVLKLL